MTFLWANIPLEWNIISIRYYCDLFWYSYSMVQMIPAFVIMFYQLWKHFIKKGDQKPGLDNTIIQYFAYPLPFYYLVDLSISIIEGTFFIPCRFWLWYHHMISLVILPALIYRNNYEWQDTLVIASHSLLMRWPHIFELNLVYVPAVLYFNIKLYMRPLRDKWINRLLGICFPFIYYSFIVLLFHDCNNALPFIY